MDYVTTREGALAAALVFARGGATLVGCDRKSDGLEETRELAEREGLTLQPSIVEDLAQSEAAKQWIDKAVGQSGRLNVLYNNAALADFALIESMTPKLWTETLRGELDITIRCHSELLEFTGQCWGVTESNRRPVD